MKNEIKESTPTVIRCPIEEFDGVFYRDFTMDILPDNGYEPLYINTPYNNIMGDFINLVKYHGFSDEVLVFFNSVIMNRILFGVNNIFESYMYNLRTTLKYFDGTTFDNVRWRVIDEFIREKHKEALIIFLNTLAKALSAIMVNNPDTLQKEVDNIVVLSINEYISMMHVITSKSVLESSHSWACVELQVEYNNIINTLMPGLHDSLFGLIYNILNDAAVTSIILSKGK